VRRLKIKKKLPNILKPNFENMFDSFCILTQGTYVMCAMFCENRTKAEGVAI